MGLRLLRLRQAMAEMYGCISGSFTDAADMK